MIAFNLNDGGRAAAGYKGEAGDCVVRAISIAASIPYQEVYNALAERNKLYAQAKRSKVAAKLKAKGATPRDGNYKAVYKSYIESLGFKWFPTMAIGQGCKVHLSADELPSGNLIVSVSRHLAAVIDGALNDTHDCSREGKRCVYGYYKKVQA